MKCNKFEIKIMQVKKFSFWSIFYPFCGIKKDHVPEPIVPCLGIDIHNFFYFLKFQGIILCYIIKEQQQHCIAESSLKTVQCTLH